jgi:hypothetical protein
LTHALLAHQIFQNVFKRVGMQKALLKTNTPLPILLTRGTIRERFWLYGQKEKRENKILAKNKSSKNFLAEIFVKKNLFVMPDKENSDNENGKTSGGALFQTINKSKNILDLEKDSKSFIFCSSKTLAHEIV